MTLKALINIDNLINIFKEAMTTYQDDMEYIATEFWISNSNREVRNTYNELSIFTRSIKAYIKNNQQKFKYLIESAKEDFISIDTTQRGNTIVEGYNKDYYGGEGKRDKDTENNEVNIKNINNFKKTYNFKSLSDNLLIRQMENKYFETFFIDENIGW